jgi:hypothetical protein
MSIKQVSGEVDGASAVAHELDTSASLATAGAKLFSVLNAGVEVFSVDKDGLQLGGGFVTVVKPAEGGQGIKDAIIALSAAGGGIVQLLEGTYATTDAIIASGINNVIVRGIGEATRIEVDSTIAFPSGSFCFRYTNTAVVNRDLDDITVGDTSIFTTTVGDAGLIVAGAKMKIEGRDTDGFLESQYVRASADGNGGTGEITIETPIRYDLTSAVMRRSVVAGKNNSIRDLKVVHVTGANGLIPFWVSDQENFIYENLIADTTLVTSDAYRLDTCWFTAVRNCRAINAAVSGFSLSGNQNAIMENCHTENTGSHGFRMADATDSIIKNCTALNIAAGLSGHGIFCSAGSVERRLIITGNRIENVLGGDGIQVAGSSDSCADNIISDNYAAYTEDGQIKVDNCERAIIVGNRGGDPANVFDVGIFIQVTKYVIAVQNLIKNAKTTGINSGNPTTQFQIISDNIILNSGSTGISVSSGNVAVIKGNVVNLSASEGIRISTFFKALLANNMVVNSTGDGIDLNAGASADNFLIGNMTNGDGIDAGSEDNTLVSNID